MRWRGGLKLPGSPTVLHVTTKEHRLFTAYAQPLRVVRVATDKPPPYGTPVELVLVTVAGPGRRPDCPGLSLSLDGGNPLPLDQMYPGLSPSVDRSEKGCKSTWR